MNLKKILQSVKVANEVLEKDVLLENIEFADIAIDSRLVKKNSVFFAIPGKSKNGSEFIYDAAKNGAIAIIAGDFTGFENKEKLIKIKCSDPFSLLVEFLKTFYSPLPTNIYAVTGTNGKTSISEFSRQITEFLGKKSASIGTLGVICNQVSQDILQKSFLTTPDIVSFYKNLSVLKQNSVDDVFIETSSIGLEQKRIAGLDICVGSFSNFTQDHLDYHQSMEQYFKCKMMLFENVLENGSIAVLNSDIPEFENIKKICQKKNHKIFTYGFEATDFKILEIKAQDLHQEVIFKFREKTYEVHLSIFGEFQAFNILCALATVMAKHDLSDEKLRELLKNFPEIKSASGRMQQVAILQNKARVFIDFAHSPDALENVLHLARKLTKSRLIVLFGCGGDRDAKKRPIMGKLACDLADLVIVSDDNPRSENPAEIRKEILAACDLTKVIEIENRKDAIEKALVMLASDDILILAGKGHEKYQIIGDKKFEFDEEKIVKNALC